MMWACIILTVTGLYFLGLPLLLLGMTRMSAEPVIVPWDPKDLPLPPVVEQHLTAVESELVARGFQSRGTWHLPAAVTNTFSILRMFVNPTTGVSAMANSMFAINRTAHGTSVRHIPYVEFTTRFASGEVFNTHNARESGAFPVKPKTTTVRAPWITDVGRLGELHAAILAAKGPGGARVVRLDENYSGDVPTFLQACMSEEFEHARDAGYIYRQLSATHFRPTVLGAYWMAWRQMSPIKQFYSRRERRKTEALLDEIGYR